MSNANPTELSVVVRGDGVAVEKSHEPNDFPVPAIAFVVRSERDEIVDVRLVDQVPDEAEPDDIGFHPKYGAEFWSVEDDAIVFERSFEAGEEYTTVYGLRASETDDLASYLSEPELEDVSPPLRGDETDDPADPVEPLDLSDPTEGTSVTDDIEAAISDVDGNGETNGRGTDAGGAPIGDVATIDDRDIVSELAAAVRSGAVDEADLETLRSALVDGAGDSVDARIRQLQSDITDLRAYTNALEEFLDEEGDAQVVLDELRASIDDLRGEVATVAGRTEENAQRIGGVDDDVSDLSASVSDLEADLEAIADVPDVIDHLADQIADLEDDMDRFEDLESSVQSIEADLEDAQSDIRSLREMRDRLTSVFGEDMQNAADD